MPRARVGLLALAVSLLMACTAATSRLSTDDGRSSSAAAAGGAGGGLLDPLPDDLDDTVLQPVTGQLGGVVRAPEGTIPIAGALVYLASEAPAPIPQHVFCDACVEPPSAEYTLSGPDGAFVIETRGAGTRLLVVQKGAFRRVRPIEVLEGDQVAPAELTTLPAASDPGAGDDIPRMAVALGQFDKIENTLAKLGLGQSFVGTLVGGTQSFDIYDGAPTASPPFVDNRVLLLTNYEALSQYHIVFFPCAGGWPDEHLADPEVQDNLRKYMQAGGRIYATDWSYDVLARIFAPPITWQGDDGTPGSAQQGIYDAPATATDAGLASWLAAQGVGTFVLEDNWTVVESVQDYEAPDEAGLSTTLSPTTWVVGSVPGDAARPATVSYQYGCGRALFSTYHTEGLGGPLLLAQEKALLYTLLEVAVCIGQIEPPS